MKKSSHFYASLGISDENIRTYDYIINEVKHGFFNEEHIRRLDNEKALKYIIAEGEYDVFKAIIRPFSYEKNEMVRRRYLVDPFSRNIIEFIHDAYPSWTRAIEHARIMGIHANPEVVIDNSVIIKPEDKEKLYKIIYESYPKKDVDLNVISDVLARQISGWGHPLTSERDVIQYSELPSLYPSLELYRKNIVTTYNDTYGCKNDHNVSNPFVELRINYDALDEQNKMYANVLVQKGRAKFLKEPNRTDLCLFVYCAKDDYVKTVSDKMSQLLGGFRMQDMLYGRLSYERVRSDVEAMLSFLDDEDRTRTRIINLWNAGKYAKVFSQLELTYYYDEKEKQFWLHKNFYLKHMGFVNNQRVVATDSKLRKRRSDNN